MSLLSRLGLRKGDYELVDDSRVLDDIVNGIIERSWSIRPAARDERPWFDPRTRRRDPHWTGDVAEPVDLHVSPQARDDWWRRQFP